VIGRECSENLREGERKARLLWEAVAGIRLNFRLRAISPPAKPALRLPRGVLALFLCITHIF
jgi:hypothetical protein